MVLKFRMTLPIHLIVFAGVMIAILSLSFAIFSPTFAQNLSNNKNADSLNNTQSENLEKLTISAKGPIVSAVKDKNGTWIIYGSWELGNNASGAAKISSSPFSFNATIIKVKTDNAESIKYRIKNFELASSSINTVGSSSILVFNGTGTLTTKGDTSQLPINVGIIDNAPVTASVNLQSDSVQPSWKPAGGTISIVIDDKAFSKNFGNLPIYGIVKKAK